MHNETVETIIGAIVVVIAVVFVIFTYRSTSVGSMDGYPLTAKMVRVDGLGVGTDVKLGGVKIGTVSALDLSPDYQITVHLTIHADVKVPDDSSLVVTSSGLLSGSYLSIQPGGSDKMLAAGGVIKNTQGAIDMMGLLNKFVNSGSSSQSSGTTPAPAPSQP